MRVVSLLPSATEALCCIDGGADMLIARSHECDWPPPITHLPVLTSQKVTATTSTEIDTQVREAMNSSDGPASLYTVDEQLLRELHPEVILTQSLCDVCSIDLATVERIAADMHPALEVVSLNPLSVEDVFDDVLRIGRAVGLPDAANRAVVALRGQYWSAVDYVNAYIPGPSVAFLEWMEPLFIGGHWTPQLIEAAGAQHPLNPPKSKSVQITPEALVNSAPERLIICPCGYTLPMIEREMDTLMRAPWWNDLPAVNAGHIALVDGSAMFNRPGPRLVDAFRWLVSWLNNRPEVTPEGFPVKYWAG